MKKTSINKYIYNACGNILGLVPLDYYSVNHNFFNDEKLRSYLYVWGKRQKLDSIMVLFGNPKMFQKQGYHYFMYVFETGRNDSNKLKGTISTMCGNGVRAVAAYLKSKDNKLNKIDLMTLGGIKTITIKDKNYQVKMGRLFDSKDILSKYIDIKVPNKNNNSLLHSSIPKEIIIEMKKSHLLNDVTTWNIGLTSNAIKGRIDDEPHITIYVPKAKTLNDLKKLALVYGPLITKNLNFFPFEINVNFYGKKNIAGNIEIMNVTHERNLGDDPEHSVTASCGTGSTVVAAFELNNKKIRHEKMKIKCFGGILEIEKKDNIFYLKGLATECKKNC